MSRIHPVSADLAERPGYRTHRPSLTNQTGYPPTTNPTPADALRTIAARLNAAEQELAEARAVLAAAEVAVAAGQQESLVPDAYTTEQVAHTLGLSRSTVAEMLRRGAIRSVKLGASRRVLRADIDAYIAGLRGEAS